MTKSPTDAILGIEREVNEMATYEVELLYDEYCMDCYAEGITPKSMVQWWEEME